MEENEEYMTEKNYQAILEVKNSASLRKLKIHGKRLIGLHRKRTQSKEDEIYIYRLFGLACLTTDHEIAVSIPGTSTNFKCGLGLERGPPSLVRTIG